MEFGHVDNPRAVEFTIPPDHPDTAKVLAAQAATTNELEVYVGCGRWSKKDLKNFYPRGTQDELAYYSTQFNSIEMNATFYRLFPPTTFEEWYATVPEGFKFFPKLEQTITHFRRMKDVQDVVERNITNMSHLREKLRMVFLQLHNNFGPKDFDRVEMFADNWTYDVPLAMEFRQEDWHHNGEVSEKLYNLLESRGITNIITDTAGRRDLMHMRLTTPTAFIRWVGTNDAEIDRPRLNEWVSRIYKWKKAGLRNLFFFVHQLNERDSPVLAEYFIERLNKKIGTSVPVPKLLKPQQ